MSQVEDAWHPGIHSTPPRELRPLATLFRPEHVSTPYAELEELSAFTGMKMEDLAVFRPRRVATHSVLIRVTADISVSDGSVYEDLGINLREIAARIESEFVAPRVDEIAVMHEALRARLETHARQLLDDLNAPPPAATVAREPPRWQFWRRRPVQQTPRTPSRPEREQAAIDGWREGSAWREGDAAAEEAHAAGVALARACTAIRARHGRLVGDDAVIARVASGLAVNYLGAERIGKMVAPLVEEAIVSLGLRRLPAQAAPVVMNVKGASAAGKSTLRPLQHALADRLGLAWEDFALISPDVWRKYLLDYDSLGDTYKYAGTFTGHELRVVDQKLDRYMATKAALGDVPHLVIDRFRFDTFAPASHEKGSNLLTRFGDLVYMVFMITPPDATVERAWQRGLQVGRYKAVDDLLHHNIEAFTGIPELFFTWAADASAPEGSTGARRVHFEFLDNSVPRGTSPRTVAFGWHDELKVLDVNRLLDIDRYTRINIDATAPAEVYPDDTAMQAERNCTFLQRCVDNVPMVSFCDHATGEVYLRMARGKVVGVVRDGLARACEDAQVAAALAVVAPGLDSAPDLDHGGTVIDEPARRDTLGAWGDRG